MRKVTIFIMMLLSVATFADNKHDACYNYNRGVEACEKENYKEAMEYFNKEVEEHPDNGYAYSFISYIWANNNDYGRAISAANNALKYIPKKDKVNRANVYSNRASDYIEVGDSLKALNDYNMAISLVPDNFLLYKFRANLYYELGKLDMSDKDCHKMIDLDNGNIMGYMYLGRNYNERGMYDEAIRQFDYANKLDPSYPSAYSFRAESYMKKKEYSKALDDAIAALNINDIDLKSHYLIYNIADSAYDETCSKLNVQVIKNPNSSVWSFDLGNIFLNKKKVKTTRRGWISSRL